MHVAIVRPLASYSTDALEGGKGLALRELPRNGRRALSRVAHAPNCPFRAEYRRKIDIPPMEGLRGDIEEKVLA